MDYCKIGQRIRNFRKGKGLSQEALAEMVNISTTHMSHIETGSTKLSLPVLVDIANALEVSTDALLSHCCHRSGNHMPDDISAVLEQCTPSQSRVLAEVIKAAKQAIDMYL